MIKFFYLFFDKSKIKDKKENVKNNKKESEKPV